jgi:hypothetical protein
MASVHKSAEVPTASLVAARMRFIHVNSSIGARSQPCLRRLRGFSSEDTYSFGTQLMIDLPALEVLESSGCQKKRRPRPESDVTI